MIGILVLTHGDLAYGFYDAAKLIVGDMHNTDYFQIKGGDDFNIFKENVLKKIIELDQGNGVVVLTDLFGASPYNAAAMVKRTQPDLNYRVVTGVNIPILLETISMREVLEMDELVSHILQIGKDNIKELFMELSKGGN